MTPPSDATGPVLISDVGAAAFSAITFYFTSLRTVAALYQGAPGQMTSLEDPHSQRRGVGGLFFEDDD